MKNISKFFSTILIFSAFTFTVVILLFVFGTARYEQLQIIRFTQYFGLASIISLYLSMIISPLSTLKKNEFLDKWLSTRNTLIFITLFFAFIHAGTAFFGQLGGFEGLFFLNERYLLAISLSFIGLLILCVLVTISLLRISTHWYKTIRRIVQTSLYIVGVVILIHAVMLGTHFQSLSHFVPVALFGGLSFLLLLHGFIFDRKFRFDLIILPRFGLITVVTILFLGFLFFRYVFPLELRSSVESSFNVHTQHIQIAENLNSSQKKALNIPGMKGDPTKRYSVHFNFPEKVNAGEQVPLLFRITDATNGNAVILFDTIYEKQLHLIIVDEELRSFTHIHPEFSPEGFQISHVFPKDGFYRLYIDFQPKGAIEQQFGFLLKVGDGKVVNSQKDSEDIITKSVVDGLVTTLKEKDFSASLLSVGKQMMTFRIEKENGTAFSDLYPYLGSFGHLVMINQQTYDYIHVHPANLVTPKFEDRSGPEIQFLPLGLNGPIKPGNYRMFLQLNPGGQLKTFPFSIKVN